MSEVGDVISATEAYEAWLRSEIDVVEADLEQKHRDMAGSLFAFLRGTFYRWASLWPEICKDLADAPKLLGVGDLHVENFGTWRDAEGRLIFGVNDLDEVARLPYPADLVRLVTSAIAARHESRVGLNAEEAASSVLAGYSEALASGGEPFVLEEQHEALRQMALGVEREPARFWQKLAKGSELVPPKDVAKLLGATLPEGSRGVRISHRTAGVGSLGRPRYVAMAMCKGGLVAREAKAWAPSAWGWAKGRPKSHVLSRKLLKHAVREPDPFYRTTRGWVLRRLGPHCSRIELSDLPRHHDEKVLLKAMGQETANLHLGTADAKSILEDLRARKSGWLAESAAAMLAATKRDWELFRQGWHLR